MANQPFRHPPVSAKHDELRMKLQALGSKEIEEKKNSFYERFRETEAIRYFDAAGFHCCYCGEKRDRLDLDHFCPKGEAKHQRTDGKLLEYYHSLARGQTGGTRLPVRKESFFVGVDDNKNIKSFSERCIDPTNIVPSCPDCNTGGKNNRDFADVPFKFGKLNRFPVDASTNTPLLLHPGEVNWNELLDYFEFIDLADAKETGLQDRPLWGGAVRATIVVPNFGASRLELEIVKAATVIEVFGLNRKALSEQRFRIRQMFRDILHNATTVNAVEESESLTEFAGNNLSLHAAAFAIRSFLQQNPHKLALLDVLREWLGDELFCSIENLELLAI